MPTIELKQQIIEWSKTRDPELKQKITDAISNAQISDLRQNLYHDLVPEQGKAETVAGEIIRALNWIGYTYYETGDVYFVGYGLDTAGSEAIYLSKISKAFETLINTLYPQQYFITTSQKKSYENFLKTLEIKLLQEIKNNPELILKRNTTDSRTKYVNEAQTVFEPFDEIANSGIDLEEDL